MPYTFPKLLAHSLATSQKADCIFFFFFFFLFPSCFQEYFSWCGVTEVVPYVVQMDFQILPLAELLKESFIVEEFPKVLNLFWCTAFQQK